ncbi:MAG: DNA replication/repair protein RecF [Proteobacteria bacterium]|jgi:DNA replication and repair protein RecF|nr:DNA replication/repair protein RecF [Pseudomonadota bacterium]
MFIRSLLIQQFRNIHSAELEFSPGFNVFYGANAQGKSNLLEAIYTLSFLKGFRADKLSELIEFDARKSVLSAVVQNGNAATRLGIELDAHTRRAFVDGMPCSRARDFLGILRSILFVPMDVGFLQAAPATRRTMLDRMIFNLKPAYLFDLDQYQKLSKQKSAVLHSEVPDEALLDVYDAQIQPAAIRIIEARYDYLQCIAGYIKRVFSAIFDDSFECMTVYKCATFRDDIVFGGDTAVSKSDLVNAYLLSQKGARAKEIARQQMALGPHRDDWSIVLNGRQAKYFASQGQQRSMCLAMKMAEIECLRQEADIEPVFLLDDVSSELDPVRHRRLFEYLNALTAQTFLTTTAREHVHIESVGRIFHVENGGIEYEC